MSDPITCIVRESEPGTPAPGDIWPCLDACPHTARGAANPRKLVLPDDSVVCLGCASGNEGVATSDGFSTAWNVYGTDAAPTAYPGFTTANGTWWLREGVLYEG